MPSSDPCGTTSCASPAVAITTPTDSVYQSPLQPRVQRGVLVRRRAPVALTEPEEGRGPRRVTREGTVKPSRNIQAPGYHQLENKEGLVNYLVPGDPELELERFRGVRVRITGTERGTSDNRLATNIKSMNTKTATVADFTTAIRSGTEA